MTDPRDDDLVPGFVLGPVIGKGGFATVHRAKQVSLDREVAVKIDSRVTDDARNARRFLREATASSLISSHPHVVSLIDAGTTSDRRPYLAMELCEGGSVAKLLKSHGPLRPADANEVAIAVAGALAAAHEHGILHRDIKPANILIDAYGTPRLGDFGLAALPTPGEELSVTLEALTPAYASPETFERAVPSKAADVWSLGATIYTLITGYSPRRNPDGSSMHVAEIIQHLADPVPAPTHVAHAEPLMRAVWRATAHEPAQRPSAAELRAMLIALRGRLGPGRDVQVHADITQITPEMGAFTGLGNATPASAATQPSPPPSTQPSAPAARPPSTPPATRTHRWVAPVAVATVVVLLASIAGLGAATSWFGLAGPKGTGEQGGDPGTIAWVAPAVGTCYGETQSLDGGVVAEQVPCEQLHTWETFATGTLGDDVASASPEDAKADPAFGQACTKAALDGHTDVAVERLRIEVLPPSPERFADGERRFSCIATSGPRLGSLG
ncbi:serine/threonine-protein kinase [uncultured Tessaracoccus sp.]|uniref:serine/threonine-protein kinase n=1 Tax=uncultured Tessaracoccus sp. TaxID=905023 RepID=UPI0026006301|nr:serine/threonine-protein kinase [uncultured Tessaracoccus sp.]